MKVEERNVNSLMSGKFKISKYSKVIKERNVNSLMSGKFKMRSKYSKVVKKRNVNSNSYKENLNLRVKIQKLL